MTQPAGSVLCIGNDAVGLNLRCSLLKQHGWTVLTACSGHSGVIQFMQEAADAAVIDLNDDGIEAALISAELKRLRPGLPVVLLSDDLTKLATGASQQADLVLLKSQEGRRLNDEQRTLLSR